MRTLVLLFVLTNAVLCLPQCVLATTLTFEDLKATCDSHPAPYSDTYGTQTAYGYAVPNGYAGLNWTYFCAVDAPANMAYYHNSIDGEVNGLTSGAVVLYNSYAYPASILEASMPVAIHSAYLTAAWQDGLGVEIDGYLGGAVRYSQHVTLSLYHPTLVTCPSYGVDKIVWSSSYNGTTVNGDQFAMDDLSFDFVPEPSCIVALLCGIGGLGVITLRRRR